MTYENKNKGLASPASQDHALSPSGTEPVPVSSADAVTIVDAITPLPWAAYRREPRKGVFGEVAADFIHAGPEPKDDTGYNVVARAYTTHGYDGVAERTANAAYIVRACNSFPDLYSAAEIAHATLTSMHPFDRSSEDEQAIEWLERAIAKARGQ